MEDGRTRSDMRCIPRSKGDCELDSCSAISEAGPVRPRDIPARLWAIPNRVHAGVDSTTEAMEPYLTAGSSDSPECGLRVHRVRRRDEDSKAQPAIQHVWQYQHDDSKELSTTRCLLLPQASRFQEAFSQTRMTQPRSEVCVNGGERYLRLPSI